MRKIWFLLMFGLSILWTPFAGAQTDYPLFEITGMSVDHTFLSDKDGQFQYGTHTIEFSGTAALGITTALHPFAMIEPAGVHEDIGVSNMPASVIAAAAAFNPPLSLQTPSFRLQTSWNLGAGVNILPHHNFEIGARYLKDGWRYDWLGYPAKTTIPYLKGMQWSRVGYVRYAIEKYKFQLTLDGGAGYSSINFHKGEEAYLSDNDGQLLSRLSGIIVPTSVELGYTLVRPFGEDWDGGIIPFVRYEYARGNFDGTTITKRQILFGGRIYFRGFKKDKDD
jgi:hypothetical protein